MDDRIRLLELITFRQDLFSASTVWGICAWILWLIQLELFGRNETRGNYLLWLVNLGCVIQIVSIVNLLESNVADTYPHRSDGLWATYFALGRDGKGLGCGLIIRLTGSPLRTSFKRNGFPSTRGAGWKGSLGWLGGPCCWVPFRSLLFGVHFYLFGFIWGHV